MRVRERVRPMVGAFETWQRGALMVIIMLLCQRRIVAGLTVESVRG